MYLSHGLNSDRPAPPPPLIPALRTFSCKPRAVAPLGGAAGRICVVALAVGGLAGPLLMHTSHRA